MYNKHTDNLFRSQKESRKAGVVGMTASKPEELFSKSGSLIPDRRLLSFQG